MIRMAKAKHKTSFLNQISKLPNWKQIGKDYGKYLI